MKKALKLIIIIIFCLTFIGCGNKGFAIDFKNEYESLNGVTNSNGKVHRTITIDKNNPYEKIAPEEVVKKIDNKETFYLYVGDSLCPWCRSVIEKSIEIAKEKNVDKIYYIDIWDEEGNEIFRDKYQIVNNELKKMVDGTESYYALLDKFKDLLSDYTLTDDNGEKVEVGEKRIYAPSYIYIENGVAKKLTEGISDKQKESREELTEEILKDEEDLFMNFFSN